MVEKEYHVLRCRAFFEYTSLLKLAIANSFFFFEHISMPFVGF